MSKELGKLTRLRKSDKLIHNMGLKGGCQDAEKVLGQCINSCEFRSGLLDLLLYMLTRLSSARLQLL